MIICHSAPANSRSLCISRPRSAGSARSQPFWLSPSAVFFSKGPQLVRAAYLVMGVTTWFVIVPLALVSLFTGIVSSLITRWDLFRYYWVLMKLVITALATPILLVHTQPIDRLSSVAAKTAVLPANLRGAARHGVCL